MPPEAQSKEKCADLMQSCRESLFSHIDKHTEKLADKMDALSVQISYDRGKANGRMGTGVVGKSSRFSWKEVAAAVVIIVSAIMSLGAVLKTPQEVDPAAIVKAVVEAIQETPKVVQLP